MKKILVAGILHLSVFGFGQKLYTKINDSKINQERLKVAQDFLNQYLDKCKNKDYSEFKGFIISKPIEKKMNEERQKACENTENIKILGFNSAHILDNTKNDDPVELYIFDINNEKDQSLKYLSTWVYQDKNVIGGLWISKEKPLYRKKESVSSKN